jgi:hypothetical protein
MATWIAAHTAILNTARFRTGSSAAKKRRAWVMTLARPQTRRIAASASAEITTTRVSITS